MWRDGGTQHWSSSRVATDCRNSHASDSSIHSTHISGHFSQLKMSGPLRSMSWKYWGHFDIGLCGCQRGIKAHCITLSHCTTTYSITWMAWRELWPRRRLHGRNTCSSLWSQLDRSCPNTPLKWLQQRECYWFLHIASIVFESCDRLESGTREWILILKTRHPILPNTNRPLWSMLRSNTVPNIDVCRSISTKAYRAAIRSPPQPFQGSVNHPSIHMICQAMMKNPERLTMWLRWHPDEVISQHIYWRLPGSIWIGRLKYQSTGGKLIQIAMITTPTQWRLVVHFGYQT